MAINPFKIFDPTLEAEYLRSIRNEQRSRVAAISRLAIAIVGLYVLLNPLIVGQATVESFLGAGSVLVAVLLAYLFALRSRFYEGWAWFDVPFVLAVFACQLGANTSFFGQALRWGASPQTVIAYNGAVFLFFTCVAIVGSVRAYALLAALISLLVVASVRSVTAFAPASWRFEMGLQAEILTLSPFLTALGLAVLTNIALDQRNRRVFLLTRELQAQQQVTEALLYNVLPQQVAQRLKSGETVADAFSEVSVIFVDIVGFSRLSKTVAPNHLVEILNSFFSLADELAEKHAIEKVKTIGDAYLAIAGSLTPVENSAISAIRFGEDMIERVRELSTRLNIQLAIRVGVHTGAVVGGVIGRARQTYDYWGDTVNVASRLQDIAPTNGIAVSEATYYRARGAVAFQERSMFQLKGIGETAVYAVAAQEAATAAS